MPIELKVPEVGESITEVEIGEWLKAVGEKVNRDEAVVMIETDKVTVELPAPVAGVITEVLVKKGGTASVGDVIGYMEEGASATQAKQSKPPQVSGSKESAKTTPASPQAAGSSETREKVGRDAGSGNGKDDRQRPGGSSGEPRIMPAARRALHDTGLSAEAVQGSGPGGRILKEDVERAAKNRAPEQRESPAARPAPQGDGYRQEEVIAMTPMRRRIAERLVESQQSAALLTTFNEADMSEVMALRKQYQPVFQDKYGIKLGFMSFFVKAAIDALKLVPQVNAEIRGTDVIFRNYYDIGVAVGGGKGLVVPIMRNAERLSFAEIEQGISDFGARAKKNQLKLEELQGGTFTISNGGVYGSLMSTPIINPPQSGILGLHAIQDRPVARDGQVVIRPMMYLALTYDHRIVDGREAVTFLKRIKEAIEDPTRMLLEV